MKAERERKETIAALERQLAAARAEVLDWRRELAAAEADRDRLMTDKKALAKRASSGSLYAGYGGTPKARGLALPSHQRTSSCNTPGKRKSSCEGFFLGAVAVLCCTFVPQLQGISNTLERDMGLFKRVQQQSEASGRGTDLM